jgi:hypothetical protein
MSRRIVVLPFLMSLALPVLASSGCTWPLNTQFAHPFVHLPVLTPVSPYFQKEQETKFWMRERYQRVRPTK